MSPLEKDQDFIHVGIALKNNDAKIPEQHYEYTSPNYLPEPKKYDKSEPIDGTDAYDNQLYAEKVKERKIEATEDNGSDFDRKEYVEDVDEEEVEEKDASGNVIGHHKKGTKKGDDGYDDDGGSGWVIVFILLILGCVGAYLYKRYKDG